MSIWSNIHVRNREFAVEVSPESGGEFSHSQAISLTIGNTLTTGFTLHIHNGTARDFLDALTDAVEKEEEAVAGREDAAFAETDR